MRLSPTASNIAANVVCRRLDGGSLRIYAGDEPPSLPESAEGDCLFYLSFAEKAFKTAAGGVASANEIGAGVALRDGKATWFAAVSASDEVIFWGSVGRTRLSDITLGRVDFKQGDILRLESFDYCQKS